MPNIWNDNVSEKNNQAEDLAIFKPDENDVLKEFKTD